MQLTINYQMHSMQIALATKSAKLTPGLLQITSPAKEAGIAMVSKSQSSSQASENGKVLGFRSRRTVVLSYGRVSYDDWDWVLEQSGSILRLWNESWRSESFGRQRRVLRTKLCGETLRRAMRALEEAGLFKYFPLWDLSKNHRWKHVGWQCENLHGYYTDYWDVPTQGGDVPTQGGDVPTQNRLVPTQNRLVPHFLRKEQPETVVEQGFQIAQLRPNYPPTTYQGSWGGVEDS